MTGAVRSSVEMAADETPLPPALAQQGLFDQPTFLKCALPLSPFPCAPPYRILTDPHSTRLDWNNLNSYLRYLLYFRDPRYARFLHYPSSLEHLSLLTAPDPAGQSFRNAWREQPLMAQEWAGKMVARWAEWRERETLEGESGGLEAGGGGGKADSVAP